MFVTDTHQVVHFNLQFLSVKTICYKKGTSLYKIRIFFIHKENLLPCLSRSNLTFCLAKIIPEKIDNPDKINEIIQKKKKIIGFLNMFKRKNLMNILSRTEEF